MNNSKTPNATAIIVAAGKGVRMQSDTRKQYMTLGARPVLSRTLQAFDRCPVIRKIYLVIPEADFQFCRDTILPQGASATPVQLVSGGAERKDSVYNGLLAADGRNEIVVIHDGVRPLIRPDQIEACVTAAAETGAGILAIPVKDTLKRVQADSVIEATVRRESLWAAQTPQAFEYDLILEAHQTQRDHADGITDDAQLVERMGRPVTIIPGSDLNLKITTPEDLALAEAILSSGLIGEADSWG